MFDSANFTQPQNWITYVNTVTDGYFGYFFLLIIFIASYMGLGYLPAEKAFAGAIWLTTFMAVLLYFIGVIPWLVLFACVLGAIVGMLMLKFSEN